MTKLLAKLSYFYLKITNNCFIWAPSPFFSVDSSFFILNMRYILRMSTLNKGGGVGKSFCPSYVGLQFGYHFWSKKTPLYKFCQQVLSFSVWIPWNWKWTQGNSVIAFSGRNLQNKSKTDKKIHYVCILRWNIVKK